MRILQLNNYADPIGGAEVYALALTRELVQRGHEVVFFGTSPEREVDETHLRVVRRSQYDPGVLYRDPTVRNALESYIGRFRPQIVHVHNVFSLGLDVLELLGTTGLPILQTVHDFSLLCPNSWCVRGDGAICAGGAGAQCFQHDCHKNYPYDPEVALITLLKQRTLAGIVDLAICPSQYLASRMRGSGFREVRHKNYFIDPIASSGPTERADRELVFIGRLEPEKGVEYLLEAMPMILREAPSVRLTIVGGGALRAALEARVALLRLEMNVSFLSHVPRAELGRFYATATACVLPSIWSENSPLVAYECLAAGLPMIASRIGGIPELVEEGVAGFTFAPRDARDLADKAVRLLALDPAQRTCMSASMRQRALEFHAEPHVTWITRVFDEVLLRGPGQRTATVQVDSDLLSILEHYGRERARLGSLFNEHVGYIRHLEKTLAEQNSPAGPGRSPLPFVRELERSLQEHKARLRSLASSGPGELLRRLARALPRVLRN